MGKASSAKKIARMAQKGKGKKVRFQNGTLFPAVMALVLVVGLALIVYARSLQNESDVKPRPQISSDQAAGTFDHWHVAYGVYNCDKWVGEGAGADGNTAALSGDGESAAGKLDADATYLGVHSHEDGVIHYHPFDTAISGKRANLDKFLRTYGVKVSKSKIEFPSAQGGLVLDTSKDKCGDKKAKIVTLVWQDAKDVKSRFESSSPGKARFGVDGMAVGIYFVPEDANINDLPETPSAANLDVLAGRDSGATPATGSTTPGSGAGSTVPGSAPASGAPESTVASGSTVAGATTVAPGTTAAPAATTPPTTAG